MRIMETILIITSVLLLGGCHFFHKKDMNYQNSASIAPLQFPSNMDTSKVKSYYLVAASKKHGHPQKVTLLPPNLRSHKS